MHFRTMVLFVVFALPVAAAATPDPSPDSNAAVVLLRKPVSGDPASGCGLYDPSHTITTTDSNNDVVTVPDPIYPLKNCFESMAALTATGTTGWIWTTRNPSASAPLLVDIGPGTFEPFFCDGTSGTGPSKGWVTLHGAGRELSILKGGNNGAKITNCANLSFIDLGVQGNKNGVVWEGSQGGSSSWSNVDLVGLGTVTGTSGWIDQNCAGQTVRSVHYFHGSRARALTGPTSNPILVSGFWTACAESWFFGGEISADISRSTPGFNYVVAVNGGFLETFGTAIRGRVHGDVSTRELAGVAVYPGDTDTSLFTVAFHGHGGNIGLSTKDASNQSIAVHGVQAGGMVHVHAPGMAYFLTPGSTGMARRAIRIDADAHVEAPFQWSADTEPPFTSGSSSRFESKDGEDLFVETDCDNNGCSGTGNKPHLMIYSTACPTSNPWFDVALNACRL